MTESTKIKIDSLEFDCLLAGNKSDDAVIFLHGFPESGMMWKAAMEEISSHGFYCIAPTMRGYSRTACPKGKVNYTVDKLRKDILDIADYLGVDKFHLVGHDWGAAIGWNIAFENEDRLKSYSALSVPHNSAFSKALREDKDQKKRSRYIGMFLLPIFPELYIQKNDFAGFKKLWEHCSPEVLEDYLKIFRYKPSLTAALNYYRANIGRNKNIRIGDINVPTLFVWGNTDMAIARFGVELNEKYMKGPYEYVEIDGGHWLIQSNYEEVKEAILKQLKKYN